MLPCHTVTDSLASLSLGHMTCFDCIFLANLAMYLVSSSRGELGQNLSILTVSPQHLEKRGKPGMSQKESGRERWKNLEAGTIRSWNEIPPGWPKAQQFTLFCKIHNGLGPALRSKHCKGARGGPYLYFYEVFGLLWVSGNIPIASIGANLKWCSVLWRHLSKVEEV